MTQLRSGLALLGCVLLLVCAGCLSLSGDSLENEVVDRIEAAEPPETVAGEQHISAKVENETIEVAQEVWYRADGRLRIETTGSAAGDSGRTVTIDDGERRWTYRPKENTVRYSNATRRSTNQLQQLYNTTSEMLAQLEVTAVDETTLDGHDVYHVVLEPGAEDETVEISVLDAITEPLSPVETGKDEPGDDTSAGQVPDRAELWLDQEFLFPLRTQFGVDNDTFRTHYENVTFNPSLPDGYFEFEPPENATVEKITLPEVEQYDDVQTADDATSFPIEAPESLPEGFELDQVTVSTEPDTEETTATLRYEGSEGEFLSIQITDGEFPERSTGESVDLNGQTGTYVTRDDLDIRQLYWDCGDLQYLVIGGEGTGREDVLTVGRSTAC